MALFMQLLFSGLAIGSVYALIGLGYSLIYKASGLMTFVQGDLLTLGAFLGLTFYRILELPFVVSVLLTCVVSFALGFLLERAVIRRLLKKNVMPIYIVLATIAVSYIVQNGCQLIWGSMAQFFPSIWGISGVKIFGANITMESISALVTGLLTMYLLHLFMSKTKLGTAMRAASMDAAAAESCGINCSFSMGLTWGIAAGLAAMAGILIGPLYGVYTTLGADIGRKGYAGAVIGGYGNMYGAMIGGLLLGVVETLTAGYIDSGLKNMIAYLLLIIFLFIKPTGLFNERAIADN